MLIGLFVHRQQNLPTGNGISTVLMSPQKGKGHDQSCTCDTGNVYQHAYCQLVPKICNVDPVCKAACTLSSTICQASSASPCAHAVTASLDSELHLGHARGAIQHAAAQSDVVQQH